MAKKQAKFDIEVVRERARRAVAPLKTADDKTAAPHDMLFSGRRTDAGRSLPAPYLVYFLLHDLLGFGDLGRFEKLAYSLPVDFKGTAYLIDHRKFGLGVFAADPEAQEAEAAEIVRLVNKGVKAAQPYFDHLARSAGEGSSLNVHNHSRELYERFEYLRRLHLEKAEEAERRKDERDVTTHVSDDGKVKSTSYHFPAQVIRREARWVGISAVEAFFSWTEHVFIHIAILRGNAKTGQDVRQLAAADWAEKFKAALGIDDAETKALYDELTAARRQLRNHVAHGAFGKDGQAFSFHSSAGAVPLLLPYKRSQESLRFGFGADLRPDEALVIIERFEAHLWDEERGRLKRHVQDYALPSILTKAVDGTYERAMASDEAMDDFVDYLIYQMDQAANMDW